MFIDIDYSKKLQEAKFHLAKPNKQIISIVSEKFKDTVNLKLGNINELNFTIPHYIDGVENPHVNLIKEKMLIRLTLGAYKEWYVIDEIEEDGEETDVFNVNAYSLGYELKGKRTGTIEEEYINATELMTKLLSETVWKIGEIHPLFNAMVRSFEISSSNILDAVLQAGETFGALIKWDTENRKISFLNMKDNGRFRGMTVNYGRFLRSIKRTRTTDEMITRMWIYGEDDLTIHTVNPSGQGYLENFSYFMYPFERDSSKRVIRSSDFMSDQLCHAILDSQLITSEKSPQILSLQTQKSTVDTAIVTKESNVDQIQLELDTILELLDMAQATGDASLISQRKAERKAKETELSTAKSSLLTSQIQSNSLKKQIDDLQSSISTESNFTPQLLDELNLYIIENEWRDDKYIDARELYEDGLKKFEELRQPKVVIDVTIDNLLNIIEEQYYWDKLTLGDLIKVKYPQMNIEYMAKIIEINYNLEERTASIVIANTSDLLNENEKLIQLLYSNSNASSLIQNNKYKWDKINAIENEVNSILTQEWDANKNKIIAGVNNTIEIGNRGIIIKNPDFPQEVVIMQSGIIALSKDGGETWKTAIKPDGIVAERLIGQIIAGQELIITNSAGTFTFDNNGAVFNVGSFVVKSNSGTNIVNQWIDSANYVEEIKDDNLVTPFEKTFLKQQWDRIKNEYDTNIRVVQHYWDNNGDSIPEIINYKSKYTDLYNYLFVITHGDLPLLAVNNMKNVTRIDSSVFELKFKDYDLYANKVDELINLRAKYYIDKTQADIDEVMDDIVWKLELTSSKGFVFKNGQIDTTISARVYRGMDNITDTIPNSGFIWKKSDKDGALDTLWNSSHVNVGKEIIITRDDVDQKAIFSCDIDITK